MEGHNHHDHSMHMNMNSAPAMVASDRMDQAHNHNVMSNSSSHHMMMMYFHLGYEEFVLFKFWRISTVAGLIGSCVGVFILAALYEGLKVLREYLMERSQVMSAARSISKETSRETSRSHLATHSGSPDGTPSASMQVRVQDIFKPHPFSVAHLVQTMLHMLQIVLSYFLMLIFMTYNVWLCIAVVLGAGAGYFAFGWRKRTVVDLNEHCH